MTGAIVQGVSIEPYLGYTGPAVPVHVFRPADCERWVLGVLQTSSGYDYSGHLDLPSGWSVSQELRAEVYQQSR